MRLHSKLKPLILLIVFSFFIFAIFTPHTYAAENVGDIINELDKTAVNAGIIGEGEQAEVTIYDFIGRFINLFLGFIGAIFLIIIIYAGFTWMMAKGNQQEVEKASKLLENATIGIIIILAAYLLTNYVVFRIIGISIGE